MLLWVIRHADAVRSSQSDDDKRPLSALGRSQARRLARFLQTRPRPAALWTSPLVRARETAQAIATVHPSITTRIAETLAPGASIRDMIDELQTCRESSCIIVGHEPHMSALVSTLLSGSDTIRVRFSPSTAALLDTPESIEPGRAQLLECVTPEFLKSFLPDQDS